MKFRQDGLVGKMLSKMVLHTSSEANSIREHTRNCLRWSHSKPQSSSTQQQHTQQQYRCWFTHTAAVSVLVYTHCSSTAAASLLGLLLGNTPCVTFVSIVLVLLYVAAVAALSLIHI